MTEVSATGDSHLDFRTLLNFTFSGIGTMVDILKHVGTVDWDRERLIMSVICLIAKGLNTYVNKVFLFFICNKFPIISKNLLSLCH